MHTNPISSEITPKLIVNDSKDDAMPTQDINKEIDKEDITSVDTEPIKSLFAQSDTKDTTMNESNEIPGNKVNSDSDNDLSSPLEDEEERKTNIVYSTLDSTPISAMCHEKENNKNISQFKHKPYLIITLPDFNYDKSAELDKDNLDQHKTPNPTETAQDVSNRAKVGSNNRSSDSEDNNEFLKFTRILPSADASPSIPILKRKLDDITSDENTLSASDNKRKRVSFHDPPVSTSISIEVYEHKPRSPINRKRSERRYNSSQGVDASNDDDIEEPVYKHNSVDPIFPDLVHCEDNINKIASKLSLPDTLPLLIKELDGNITTVGDLASLTEQNLHKFSIKTPKLTTAKIVLGNYYLDEFNDGSSEQTVGLEDSANLAVGGIETDEDMVADVLTSVSCTSRIIRTCLLEQQYEEPLAEMYRAELQQQIFDKLPLGIVTDLVRDKAKTDSDRKVILKEIINDAKGLEMLKTYLKDTFSFADILDFHMQLLQDLREDIKDVKK